MTTPAPDNMFTDRGRELAQNRLRGREVEPGIYRNFCRECGLPLEVRAERQRYCVRLLCEECGVQAKGGAV